LLQPSFYDKFMTHVGDDAFGSSRVTFRPRAGKPGAYQQFSQSHVRVLTDDPSQNFFFLFSFVFFPFEINIELQDYRLNYTLSMFLIYF